MVKLAGLFLTLFLCAYVCFFFFLNGAKRTKFKELKQDFFYICGKTATPSGARGCDHNDNGQ